MTTVSVLLTKRNKKDLDTQIKLKDRYVSQFFFCLLQKHSSTHLTLHPLDLKTTPAHPSSILQWNKYLTQTNVSSPGSSFDTIKHSNHIGHNMFVIQFLIWGQCKRTPPPTHACLKSYTSWLVYRQIYQVYVQYMFTYILQYASWRAHWILQPGHYQAKLTAPLARMRSGQCTQQCFYFVDIDKEFNL